MASSGVSNLVVPVDVTLHTILGVSVNGSAPDRVFAVLCEGVLFCYAHPEVQERLFALSNHSFSCASDLAFPLRKLTHRRERHLTSVTLSAPAAGHGQGFEARLDFDTSSETDAWAKALKKLCKGSGAGGDSGRGSSSIAKDAVAHLPKPGDHVVAFHEPSCAFYTSTVRAFDPVTCTFTVEWDDGDATGRIVKFDKVAMDMAPRDEREVSIGSTIIYPYGQYRGGDANAGGMRYCEGRVDRVKRTSKGTTLYSGVAVGPSAKGRARQEFHGLPLDEIRMSPNVLELLNAGRFTSPDDTSSVLSAATLASADVEQGYSAAEYDVFLAFHPDDVSTGGAEADGFGEGGLPSYGELIRHGTDPRRLKQAMEAAGLSVWADVDSDGRASCGSSYQNVVEALRRSKTVVFCVSNALAADDRARMQFEFAKVTLKKDIICCVVESRQQGPPWDWQTSVVGLLMAGALYIDLTDIGTAQRNMGELIAKLRAQFAVDGGGPHTSAAGAGAKAAVAREGRPGSDSHQAEASGQDKGGKTDVFISYCWHNSYSAYQASQVPKLHGNELACPRRVAERLAARGLRVWLDIEQLESAGRDGASIFEQIAAGLNDSKVVVAFVSSQYAKSDNCRMELQFAAKSLRKPLIAVEVGAGGGWEATVVGLIVHALPLSPVKLSSVASNAALDEAVVTIVDACENALGTDTLARGLQGLTLGSVSGSINGNHGSSSATVSRPEGVGSPTHAASAPVGNAEIDRDDVNYTAPRVGDHVLAFHSSGSFYMATVEAFEREKLSYHVRWDDNDPSGRVVSYDNICRDVRPQPYELGVGAKVVFPQGNYQLRLPDGKVSRGTRYHHGVIDGVEESSDGTAMYRGHHTSDAASWIRQYERDWVLPIDDLRTASNAIDVLMACREMVSSGAPSPVKTGVVLKDASRGGSGGGRDGSVAHDTDISSGSSEAEALAKGTVVRANWKGRGKYYPGIVVKVRPGNRYDIQFNDGDFEAQVPGARIQAAAASANALSVGVPVRANWKGKGKMYNGVISAVQANGAYDIQYSDGDFEARVPRSRIELI